MRAHTARSRTQAGRPISAAAVTARVLHDEVAQDLFVARSNLFELAAGLPLGSSERDLAESAQAAILRALLRTREVIGGLQDDGDTTEDLSTALRRELMTVAAPSGISVSFTETGWPADLSPDAVDHVRGIVHEALVNVRKHAGASEVKVNVRQHFGWTRVTVADDGHGLDAAPPTVGDPGSGCGLGLMTQRARLIGGRMGFSSAAGSGTVLTLDIPPANAARDAC